MCILFVYTYGMSTPKMSQEDLESMPVSILVKLILNQQETIESLTHHIDELTDQIRLLVKLILNQQETIESLAHHIDELTEQIRLMNQRSFGRKTESAQFVQQLQLDLGLNEAEDLSDEKAKEEKNKR